MLLSGWGRFPRVECRVHRPSTPEALRALVGTQPLIARGNGRGYGDCAVNAAATVDMRRFNRMLAFDGAAGVLTVEAGVLLADVIDAFLPRGWFPYVTPGTRFVTLGGMVAADVHGKNHHGEGSFGRYVEWLDLMDGQGEVRRCSRTEEPELFAWTIGGMGLTGVILRVAFRLRRVQSGWIRQTTLPARDLDTVMSMFEDHADATYSVAWIDCLHGGSGGSGSGLGRSALMLGEHAAPGDLDAARRADPFAIPRGRTLRVPFDAPQFALNPLSVRGFNALYYRRAVTGQGESLVGWASYFYPLDALADWNRIYGRRGFAQFQCVIPTVSARAGLTALLREIGASGQGSFLAVLKRMGAEEGPVSFPREGYTLALDFPVKPRTLALMERLDAITLDHGGRFYLAKDARMSAATLARSDPRHADFREFRERRDLAAFRSAQAERLQL